jgi:hypothetical protein
MKPTVLSGSAVAIALTAVFFYSSPASRAVAALATPPPTPPPIGQTTPGPAATVFPLPTVTPSAEPSVPMKGTKVRPSPTPPPNARKGLDGVWEVAIQHSNSTDYTHFAVKQDGGTLTGTYLDAKGKRYPLAGSVDGQDIRLIVTMPNGTTLLLEGKLDGTSDMVGMLTMPDGTVPFTAAYRAKEKWIDNVNPSPGGISQPGSYTPP